MDVTRILTAVILVACGGCSVGPARPIGPIPVNREGPATAGAATVPTSVYVLKPDAPKWAEDYWRACKQEKAYQIDRITSNIASVRDQIGKIQDKNDVKLARLQKGLSEEQQDLKDETDPRFIDEPDMLRPTEGAGVINGIILRVVTDRDLRVDANFAGEHSTIWVVVNSTATYTAGGKFHGSVVADGNQEEDGKTSPRVQVVQIRDYLVEQPAHSGRGASAK